MTDKPFTIPVDDVTGPFNELAHRDMFSDVIVIGRFKSDAYTEEKEDGYDFYVASSCSAEETVNLMKESTKEWEIGG